MTISPAGLSIPAGGGGFATVTVARTGGFSGSVTLSLEGGPTGVTGSGTVAEGAQTGRLSLLVASDVAAQTCESLRVKGASGSIVQLVSFRLVVTSPLPTGRIRTDQVQASGGSQSVSAMENQSVIQESVQAVPAKDVTGTSEARSGFLPVANSN